MCGSTLIQYIMCSLLTEATDINFQSFDGKSALHIAASGGHFDCLKLLLERGADPNLVDSWFETALFPGELIRLLSFAHGLYECFH
jgi:ankyrin repeat protein